MPLLVFLVCLCFNGLNRVVAQKELHVNLSVGALDGGNRWLEPSFENEFGLVKSGYNGLILDHLVSGMDISTQLNSRIAVSAGWWLTLAELGYRGSLPVYHQDYPFSILDSTVHKYPTTTVGGRRSENLHTFPLMIGYTLSAPAAPDRRLHVVTSVHFGPTLQYFRRYDYYQDNPDEIGLYQGLFNPADSTEWLLTGSYTTNMRKYGLSLRGALKWTLCHRNRKLFYVQLMADQGLFNLIEEQVRITANGDLRHANILITKGSFWGVATGVAIGLNQKFRLKNRIPLE